MALFEIFAIFYLKNNCSDQNYQNQLSFIFLIVTNHLSVAEDIYVELDLSGFTKKPDEH